MPFAYVAVEERGKSDWPVDEACVQRIPCSLCSELAHTCQKLRIVLANISAGLSRRTLPSYW